MTYDLRTVAIAATICLAWSVVRPAPARTQAVGAPSDETLVIAGDVTQTLTLRSSDLKTMPRTTVTVSEEGRQVSYEGVLVS
jgi:hypothetical protein